MTQAKMTPLRRRMVEDMQLRGLGAKTQVSRHRIDADRGDLFGLANPAGRLAGD